MQVAFPMGISMLDMELALDLQIGKACLCGSAGQGVAQSDTETIAQVTAIAIVNTFAKALATVAPGAANAASTSTSGSAGR